MAAQRPHVMPVWAVADVVYAYVTARLDDAVSRCNTPFYRWFGWLYGMFTLVYTLQYGISPRPKKTHGGAGFARYGTRGQGPTYDDANHRDGG